MNYKFKVKKNTGERLDVFLTDKLNDRSRSNIKKLIEEGHILVNEKSKKAGYLVQIGDIIKVDIPEKVPLKLKPESIKLDIVYEDEDIAIINKPFDLVVHPGDKNPQGTLANALLHYFENLSDIAGRVRPGIVHRLDKDTSGLMIVAKNNFSHKYLSKKFKDRDIQRIYIALVKGVLKRESGTINKPIGRDEKNRTKMVVNYKNGKRAVTHYKVIERFNKFTLVELELVTGRTHQIRAHLSHINHPILGDHVYYPGKMPFKIEHQLLHCIRLGFTHPRTEIYMEFKTDMPERFKEAIRKIKDIR